MLDKMPFYKGRPVWWQGDEYDELRDNSPFEKQMTLIGFSRGCSSAKMIIKDQEEREYEVFLKDAPGVINNMIKGVITGYWQFVKRGQNYGVFLLNNSQNKECD